MDAVDKILGDRAKTHGNFEGHAFSTQTIKQFMKISPNWEDLDYTAKEALEMIAHKIGRILNGDPTYVDHWDDIAGYAKLVSKYHRG